MGKVKMDYEETTIASLLREDLSGWDANRDKRFVELPAVPEAVVQYDFDRYRGFVVHGDERIRISDNSMGSDLMPEGTQAEEICLLQIAQGLSEKIELRGRLHKTKHDELEILVHGIQLRSIRNDRLVKDRSHGFTGYLEVDK